MKRIPPHNELNSQVTTQVHPTNGGESIRQPQVSQFSKLRLNTTWRKTANSEIFVDN